MAKEKKKFTARIKDWFRGMKSELKKVVWPNKKQVANNSLVVLVTVVATGIVIWGVDSLMSGFIRVLVDLIG